MKLISVTTRHVALDPTRDDHRHPPSRAKESEPAGLGGKGDGESAVKRPGEIARARARGHHEAEPKRRPEVAGHVA